MPPRDISPEGRGFSERSGDPELAEGSPAQKDAARSAATSLEGHDFSRAENNAARSATSEEVRGNPARVSPAPSLENGWIEVFRAGDYGERGRWTQAQLDQLAADYDPRRHAAPVVLGHPADDAPAYAWVKRLRRAGQSLWAQLEKVDPLFEALLRAGRFAHRSVALYTNFPATGGPYLRHLGFLGAAPPALKGLAPLRFAESPSVSFEFSSDPRPYSEETMTKSRLDSFLDHLRAFFTATPETASTVIPSDPESRGAGRGGVEGPAFSDRLTALEHRLDALTEKSVVIPPAPSGAEGSGGRQAEVEGPASLQIAAFVESLRSRGRFPPAFDRWGVAEFMERLAAADTRASSNEQRAPEPEVATSIESKPDARSTMNDNSLLPWFQDFLTKLPAVIEFGELGDSGSHGSRVAGHESRLVHFTEPHRGMSIDPASVELAERAEALAVQLGISYAEALTRLREEHRRTATTA